MTSFLDAAHSTRPVVLSESDPRWPAEYAALAVRLRAVAGAAALRIDHIGSTSVPGLAAKDVIDIQVTVADIDVCDGLLSALRAIGFRRGDTLEHDEARDPAITAHQLRKRYMREPVGEKRVHVHIRQQGMLRQRHALLFRDFLRATPEVREGYEMMKRRAAELYPRNIDAYLWLKAPIIHVIHVTAESWADGSGWAPGAQFD